jgi:hypothetical protein
MRTDALAEDVAALRAAGIAMSEKQPMSRLRPDGYGLEWTLALSTKTQGVTPFLIEDITPREERVPPATDHANGATGIAALMVAVPDLAVPRRLALVLGDGGRPLEREDIGGQGIHVMNGPHALDFIAGDGNGAIADFRARRGGEGGVFALSLKTTGQETRIEPARAFNARLSLVRN